MDKSVQPDSELTIEIEKAEKLIDIKVLAHIIVSISRFCSFDNDGFLCL
ncbi:JAB domain-containing protein [Daejeonella sp.]|jgi:DNA repair protein RadC